MRIASPYFQSKYFRAPFFLAFFICSSLCLASQKHRSKSAPIPKVESGTQKTSPQETPASSLSENQSPPAIAHLLKPEVLSRILKKREVMTYADLAEPKPELSPAPGSRTTRKELKPLREYRYYAGVEVLAPLEVTRSVIKNYSIYTQLVPYIDRAELNPESQELQLEGGIWKYRIKSKIRFEEIGDRWIRFRITQGHFLGMRGEFILEPQQDLQGRASTLVLVRGSSEGRIFPPDWVVEQGAQVVFSLTGNKLRKYIEENQNELIAGSRAIPTTPSQGGDNTHELTLPKPRRKL